MSDVEGMDCSSDPPVESMDYSDSKSGPDAEPNDANSPFLDPAAEHIVPQQTPQDQGGPQAEGMTAQCDDFPNASAPRDFAMVYLQVDWAEALPLKWKTLLEMALQTWANEIKNKVQLSFENLQLLDGGTIGEIQITPSSALNTLKEIKTAEVTFKKLAKKSLVHFLVEKPERMHEAQASESTEELKNNKTVAQETAGASDAVKEADLNKVLAQSQFPSIPPGEGCGIVPVGTVPVLHYWYLSQAYRKDLEQLENDFGVYINNEVSLTIKPKKNTKMDSLNEAIQKFTDLFQEALKTMKSVKLSPTQLESDIGKAIMLNISNEQDRMVLSRSADTSLLFAPGHVTSMVEKHLKQIKSPNTTVLKVDPQAPLEMEQTHWELMTLAYQSQISDMESKYGVTFDTKSVQGSTLVMARSRGGNPNNLQTHALTALTKLYQKVIMSTVTCGLNDPSKAKTVSEMFGTIRHYYPCVVAGQRHGEWKLVGLPQHLIPAIDKLEQMIGYPVFDAKTKQFLGYPNDYPQASGSRCVEMGKEAMGWRSDADMKDKTDANGDARKKEHSKDKEEDICPICMDIFTQKTKLDCGHEFCKECLNESEKNLGKICALCKKVYGTLIGNQPNGTMKVFHNRYQNLTGFNNCGTIEITYSIPGGIQTHEHPNPGRYYHGTRRTAYLPDNSEGNHVLKLLQRAFNQRLIFTVGTSRTSGADDSVIWNDIHHKTSIYGGAQNFGYPDPDYLRRVKEELKAKGIE